MVAVTRSKAKQASVRRSPSNTRISGRGFKRVTRAARGASVRRQRKHLKRLQSVPASAIQADARFITPAPSMVMIPGAPQKLKRPVARSNPPNPPPVFDLRTMESIEEDARENSAASSSLGSPFLYNRGRMLVRHETFFNLGTPRH